VIAICSYCRKNMGEKYPFDEKSVTHGICPDCFDYYIDRVDGMSFDAYLDRFEIPVLIVDVDGRIVASNKHAAEMTGKSQSELFDLLGGDAMECIYARLPGGCGKTVHCPECTIRNTVQATLETGDPQMNVPAVCKQEDRDVKMIISTEMIGGLVRLVIESVAIN